MAFQGAVSIMARSLCASKSAILRPLASRANPHARTDCVRHSGTRGLRCGQRRPNPSAACNAAYRAVVPSPLPSDEELVAKGPEYANAFIERVGEAGRRLTDCYQRAFLIEERQDAATAAGLDALRDAGASLGATGAGMLSQPTPTLAAPPEPPPGIVPPNADQMMSQARKPQPPPWCRLISPYSNTTACPPP